MTTQHSEHSTISLASWSIVRSDHLIAATSLAVGLIYATLRYNVFKGVPWTDWPTYIVNKAFGLSSLVLMAWAVKRWSDGKASRMLMLWSGLFAVMHVWLSLILLSPSYYPKFFNSGKFNAIAAFSLLFGAAAIALQELGAHKAQTWQPITKYRMLGLLVVVTGLHAALPGLAGWFAISTWPGSLPPITLISAAIAVLTAGSVILGTSQRG